MDALRLLRPGGLGLVGVSGGSGPVGASLGGSGPMDALWWLHTGRLGPVGVSGGSGPLGAFLGGLPATRPVDPTARWSSPRQPGGLGSSTCLPATRRRRPYVPAAWVITSPGSPPVARVVTWPGSSPEAQASPSPAAHRKLARCVAS